MGSQHSCDSDHPGRKVVWPANAPTGTSHSEQQQHASFQSSFKQATSSSRGRLDQPHRWLQQAVDISPEEHAAIDKDIEKRTWDMKQGNRIARSRSRSKNIMERARSFERAAADSASGSRAPSRTGSISRHRSPSIGNRSQAEEARMNLQERPASRTDTDGRQFADIGRVDTSPWEGRIHGSTENMAMGRTPPPRRREFRGPAGGATSREDERFVNTKTPEPPPPPTRVTYVINSVKVPEPPFPRPPSEATTKLSQETIQQLEEEQKEDIVKQWVESTANNNEDLAKELEKFAYDIAETVVSNMEKGKEKKVRELFLIAYQLAGTLSGMLFVDRSFYIKILLIYIPKCFEAELNNSAAAVRRSKRKKGRFR